MMSFSIIATILPIQLFLFLSNFSLRWPPSVRLSTINGAAAVVAAFQTDSKPSPSNGCGPPLPCHDRTLRNDNRSRSSASSSVLSSSALAADTVASVAEELRLDVDRLRRDISAGRVYQQQNFLSEDDVSAILNEVEGMKRSGGAFAPSGLSNTARGSSQNFDGTKDRKVAPVPWWAESLAMENNNNEIVDGKSGSTSATTLEESSSARLHLSPKLRKLRTALAGILGRPTMVDPSLAHECYYSVASEGSNLPRHMDERHEELKGARGWLLPSRRSLSWLIYLSDDGWTVEDNGGALRFFPQTRQQSGGSDDPSSTHEGNLQIGWLVGEGGSGSVSAPVYLDSWYPVMSPQRQTELCCVLYTLDGNRRNGDQRRRLLTNPWLAEALGGASMSDFIQASAEREAKGISDGNGNLFLNSDETMKFALLEDRAAWEKGADPAGCDVPVDVNPLRGSLVVFDSVLVPHQVETIKRGTRTALAGWFHEETQSIPDDILMAASQ